MTESGRIDEARRLLANPPFELALVHFHLPDGENLDLLRGNALSENTSVLVMTAFGGVREAVEAIRLGAGDYLSKPFRSSRIGPPLAFQR